MIGRILNLTFASPTSTKNLIKTKFGDRNHIAVMDVGYLVEGGPPNVRGSPIFKGRNEIQLLDKALKFGVIFQKYALKLKKFEKVLRKFYKDAKFS